MDSRINKEQFYASKTFYNPTKNRYEMENQKSKFIRNK